MAHVVSEDSELIFLVPLLLIVRAAALGDGLVVGSIFPPRERPPVVVGFSFPVWFTKRIIDIVGSTVGMILSVPFIGLAAILIKLDNPGPVLFRQERVGKNGRTFQMVKLRTMVVAPRRRSPKFWRQTLLKVRFLKFLTTQGLPDSATIYVD
jgi:hypothetical protein